MMCFVCNEENGTFKTNSKTFIPDIKFQLIIIYFSVCMVFERAKAVRSFTYNIILFVLVKNKVYLRIKKGSELGKKQIKVT